MGGGAAARGSTYAMNTPRLMTTTTASTASRVAMLLEGCLGGGGARLLPGRGSKATAWGKGEQGYCQVSQQQ